MTPVSARHYRCPKCVNTQLELHESDCADAPSSTMSCTGCGALYPIVNGIPRFVAVDNYAKSFGYQWNVHARTQLDSYTGLPISRTRLFEVTGWAPRLDGETVLEAGSGAGRFTEVLVTTGADIYSFDYSAAVDANARNNVASPNLHIFQGDIFNIPLRKGTFDKVLCLGVIQHTPDPEVAFASLASMVKPGGELAIDVYARTLAALLHWRYLLRPITMRVPHEALYKAIAAATPPLIPLARALRRIAGRAGARLVPIVEFSHLGLPLELNRHWAVLDTFDMYSPKHDHPRSIPEVRAWYDRAGFTDVEVKRGPNGVIAKGRKGASA